MAMLLRDENKLATLRCGLRMQGRVSFMVTQPFLGAKPLSTELLTPLDALGLVFGPSGQGLVSDEPAPLPFEILQQTDGLNTAAVTGASLWLQLDRGARAAALYPWEGQLAACYNRSVLRIPNFLVNPWLPRIHLRLAICASAPQTGGAEALASDLARFLRALAAARRGSVPMISVTLFAGMDNHDRLCDLALSIGRDMDLEIAVPAPAEAGAPDEQKPSDQPPQNPWLAWMARHYAGTGVDAVQFLCQGYASGNRAALVLAESPARRTDDMQTRFVEIEALVELYDRLGCAIMGFTPPGPQVWAEAIQTLAYQLAWSRPGPILIDDKNSEVSVLSAMWRMLLVGEGVPASPPLSLPCYIHPSLTAPAHITEDLQAPSVTDNLMISNSFGAAKPGRELPDVPLTSIFNPPEGGRKSAQDDSAKRASREMAQPPADALAERILEGQRARLSAASPLSALEEARDRGTLAALDFLEQVIFLDQVISQGQGNSHGQENSEKDMER